MGVLSSLPTRHLLATIILDFFQFFEFVLHSLQAAVLFRIPQLTHVDRHSAPVAVVRSGVSFGHKFYEPAHSENEEGEREKSIEELTSKQISLDLEYIIRPVYELNTEEERGRNEEGDHIPYHEVEQTVPRYIPPGTLPETTTPGHTGPCSHPHPVLSLSFLNPGLDLLVLCFALLAGAHEADVGVPAEDYLAEKGDQLEGEEGACAWTRRLTRVFVIFILVVHTDVVLKIADDTFQDSVCDKLQFLEVDDKLN